MNGRFLWICFGGAMGTAARYAVSGWALKALGGSFAYGTLAVNVIGSFLIAVVMHVGLTTEMISPTLRVTLATGVMGGFTTYSAFSYETIVYFLEGAWGLGALNVTLSLIGCLGACLLGFAFARWLVGT